MLSRKILYNLILKILTQREKVEKKKEWKEREGEKKSKVNLYTTYTYIESKSVRDHRICFSLQLRIYSCIHGTALTAAARISTMSTPPDGGCQQPSSSTNVRAFPVTPIHRLNAPSFQFHRRISTLKVSFHTCIEYYRNLSSV